MNSAFGTRCIRLAWSAFLGGCAVAAPGLARAGAPAHVDVSPRITSGGTIPAPPNTPTEKSLLLQMQDAFINIAQTVEPTVVNIKAERQATTDTDGGDGSPSPLPNGRPGGGGAPGPSAPSAPTQPPAVHHSLATGSGVIIRGDGYILTNDHVVEGAIGDKVTVTLADGREFTGKVFPDYKSDLAVVKIDPGSTPLPAAEFAKTETVLPGQWALAVGSPFDLQNTVTVGVISATGRHQRIAGDGQERYYPDLIQTDAAINPGNSGGPLFNIDGKIVGINVAIESPSEGSAGVGFAIPISIAQQVGLALIANGKVQRGYLGLAPTDLTPAVEQQFGQAQGAFVQDVVLDSPAGKAGIQASDIVTSFNGQPVTDEITLRQAIAATTPGQKVTIAYVRDGRPSQTVATIAPPPGMETDSPIQPPPPGPARLRLGLGIRDLTAHDRVKLGLPADATGVVIASVTPGGPAEAAAANVYLDLTSAVIQKINRTPIRNKEDFAQAMSTLEGPEVTLVLLYNDTDDKAHQQALTLRL